MLEELPRESPSLELLKTQVGTATCSWPFSEQEVGVGDLECHTASVSVWFCECCCWTTEHPQTCGFSVNVNVTLGW